MYNKARKRADEIIRRLSDGEKEVYIGQDIPNYTVSGLALAFSIHSSEEDTMVANLIASDLGKKCEIFRREYGLFVKLR